MSVNAGDKLPLILAQLARAPVAGQVKTRMLPFLSPQQACELHSRMVEHCCSQLCSSGLGSVELWVAGEPQSALFRRCSEQGLAALRTQPEGDLGARMAAIVAHSLARAEAVILVGSDAPAIDKDYLASAVAALRDNVVVLGPAWDGGYVLLGMRRQLPQLFENMPWGSDTVLEMTEQRLHDLQFDRQSDLQSARQLENPLSYQLLRGLPDIDRPEDLQHLPATLAWTHKP